jgi:predicted GIY-YIG superfamily endonuclease
MVCRNPFKLSFVLYRERHSLPNCSGIYYLLNRRHQQIIYIGRTKDLKQRWMSHHKGPDAHILEIVYGEAIVIAWEACPLERLYQQEKEAIAIHQPLINDMGGDKSNDTLYEEWWDDSFEYNLYLVEACEDSIIEESLEGIGIETSEFRIYHVARTNLIGLLNYRHPVTHQVVPVYRHLEKSLISNVVNADKGEPWADFASAIYSIGNEDVKAISNYFRLISLLLDGNYDFEFVTSQDEEEIIFGLATLLGDLTSADVNANNEIVPIADTRAETLAALEEPESQDLMLELTDPSLHDLIQESWETLLDLAWVGLDEESEETPNVQNV